NPEKICPPHPHTSRREHRPPDRPAPAAPACSPHRRCSPQSLRAATLACPGAPASHSLSSTGLPANQSTCHPDQTPTTEEPYLHSTGCQNQPWSPVPV